MLDTTHDLAHRPDGHGPAQPRTGSRASVGRPRRRHRRLAGLGLALSLTTALVGCGGGGEAPEAPARPLTAVHLTDDVSADDGAEPGYAEIKGRVLGTDDSWVTLTALAWEGLPGVTLGAPITVDIAGAAFHKGAPACLVPGAPIEVKGVLDTDAVLVPLRVEVEDGCAAAAPVVGVALPWAPSPGPVAARVVVDGAIVAVHGADFDLAVYTIEPGLASGAAPAMLSVRIDPATTFNHLAPQDLRPGAFVDVGGTLTDGILLAERIGPD